MTTDGVLQLNFTELEHPTNTYNTIVNFFPAAVFPLGLDTWQNRRSDTSQFISFRGMGVKTQHKIKIINVSFVEYAMETVTASIQRFNNG